MGEDESGSGGEEVRIFIFQTEKVLKCWAHEHDDKVAR